RRARKTVAERIARRARLAGRGARAGALARVALVGASLPRASAPLPKFVIHRRNLQHELRKQRGTSNFMILVRLLNLRFLNEHAARMIGTSNSPALVPRVMRLLAQPYRASQPPAARA